MLHVCMHCFLVGSMQRYSAEVSGIKSLVVHTKSDGTRMRKWDWPIEYPSFKLLAQELWRAVTQLYNFIQVCVTHIIGLEITRLISTRFAA